MGGLRLQIIEVPAIIDVHAREFEYESGGFSRNGRALSRDQQIRIPIAVYVPEGHRSYVHVRGNVEPAPIGVQGESRSRVQVKTGGEKAA